MGLHTFCSVLCSYRVQIEGFVRENICLIGYQSKPCLSYYTEWEIDAKTLISTVKTQVTLIYAKDLIDLHVASLSCLREYGEVGLRLFNNPITEHNSPCWQWIIIVALPMKIL